jgi:hypothetical protein
LININDILTTFQEVSSPNLETSIRSEVATSSRPKQQIISALKQKEKKKSGQAYKPSKQDERESQNINWKSPVFWPMIDQAAKEQIGRPNLNELIRTLQRRDDQFKYLTHQRISDWRDKTQKDKLVWSEKTLEDVQKGFLPNGNQTCFNVFVSFHIQNGRILLILK